MLNKTNQKQFIPPYLFHDHYLAKGHSNNTEGNKDPLMMD